MAKITIIFKGEEKHTTLKVGESLYYAAEKLGIDESKCFGFCHGNCGCGTCHVYVKQGAEYFEKPIIEEDRQLGFRPNLKDNSRLACQIKVSENHDEIVVEVADS